MKIYPGLVLVLLFVFLNAYSNAQEYEISFHESSGFFCFGGKSAVESTSIQRSFNPYGRKSGFCLGAAFQIQSISKLKIITGLQIGYQSFSSRVQTFYHQSIDHHNNWTTVVNETGEAYITFGYWNIYPYLGRRIEIRKVDLDLLGGIELGLTPGNGQLTFTNPDRYHNSIQGFSNSKYPFSVGTPDLDVDVRPNIQLIVHYSRCGFSIGYFYGLSNYIADKGPDLSYIDKGSKVYSRMLRLGIDYRIHINSKSEK